MMNWVIPRLNEFYQLHPHIDLRFNLNYDRVDFVRDEISVAIRNNTIEPPRDVDVRSLIDEEIGPVCSPIYLSKNPIENASMLDVKTLISTKTRSLAWDEWTESANIPHLNVQPHQQYEHFYLLIQAAICGLGVAVVPRILVLTELALGRLVAPLGFVKGPRKLVLWVAPHLRLRPETRALVNWIDVEMRKTDAA